ncbi:MAG TPA: hypothetical protein VM223_19710 [Planctomycetota bacterium]|nr:hypothetical protein [Planctomycetota bacterium]
MMKHLHRERRAMKGQFPDLNLKLLVMLAIAIGLIFLISHAIF